MIKKKKIYQITQIWNEFLFLVLLFPSHFKAHESWAPDVSKLHFFSPVLCMLYPSTEINKLRPLFLLSSSLLIQLSHHLPNDRMTVLSHHTPIKNFLLKNSLLGLYDKTQFSSGNPMECLPRASLLPCLVALFPAPICTLLKQQFWSLTMH